MSEGTAVTCRKSTWLFFIAISLRLWCRAWNQIYNSIVTAFFPNGSFPTRQAILAENELANKQTSDADPYDQ